MLTQAPQEGEAPFAISMTLSREGGVAVISIDGEIDCSTAPQLQQYIDTVVELGQLDVVIDATDLRFMDSTGLAVIVRGLKAIHANNGALSFRNPQPIVQRVLEVSGIASRLD